MNDKIKILIGDDSVQFGVSLASALRTMGFYVLTRPKDGLVILDAIRSENPQVVVADAVMPGLDAIGLIKKFKQGSSVTPLFIITGAYDNAFIEQQVMQAGAAYYMLKPIDAKVLGDRIRTMLDIDTDITGE